MYKKIFKYLIIASLISVVLGLGFVVGLYYYITPTLPKVTGLETVQLQEPLRVYTQDAALIAEYGNKRRIPVNINDIPQQLQLAFIAAEDDRFYSHPGVDWMGIARAAWVWLSTGSKTQGGSTITMQVARNFFLTPDKKIIRKVKEIFLALKINQQLSKDKVLELYLNKIYLGKRSYGVAAAAKVYYNKTVDELTLSEIAMIAGLPKAPSNYNPIINPTRAKVRRNYVLRRMHAIDAISAEQYQASIKAPITATVHELVPDVEAHYLGEMARAKVSRLFPDALYDSGLRVYTTAIAKQQRAANNALRQGLLNIDKRHGYRGAIAKLDTATFSAKNQQQMRELMQTLRKDYGNKPTMQLALVTGVSNNFATVQLANGTSSISVKNMAWARKYFSVDSIGPRIKKAQQVVAAGDVVRVSFNAKGELMLSQVPYVEGAIVAIKPQDGAITALAGGFDFFSSKFNRATQAYRQLGSSFKPFLYTAALDQGFSPASTINDAPVVFEDRALESKWKPENYSGKVYGPTRLRVALKNSRNLVSIRLMMRLGVEHSRNYIRRFGFDLNSMPRDLSLALGSNSATPLNLATGFAVFANNGYKIEPYFIERIEDGAGKIIYRQPHLVSCLACSLKKVAANAASSNIDELVKKDNSTAPNSATNSTDTIVDTPKTASANVESSLSMTTIKGAASNPEPELVAQVYRQAQQVLQPTTVFLIRSMLQDVVKSGTAARAKSLQRNDLGGKTGTTNDQIDAWFAGFNNDVVASVWVGNDKLKPMGRRETGSSAALPIWISFMREAVKGTTEKPLTIPSGIVSARIDPASGLLARPEQQNAIFEYFSEESIPTEYAPLRGDFGLFGDPEAPNATQQPLF